MQRAKIRLGPMIKKWIISEGIRTRSLRNHIMRLYHEIEFKFKEPEFRKQLIRGIRVILLLLVFLWVVSVGTMAGSLFYRVTRLRQMAADPKHINLSALAPEIHGARREVTILRGELAPMLWICARFSGDLSVAKPFVDAGFESLAATDEVMSALAPSLGNYELSTFSMTEVPQILDAIAGAHSALAGANVHISAAAAALERIKGPLSPRTEKWVLKVDQLVELAQLGISGAQIMPGLLGQSGLRTYLILLQNSDELRPTGGFISAIGRVQIDQGKLISMTAEDSYAMDDFTKVYPDPPQPLLDYMGSEQWVLRDANWSPDFPTTANNAIKLYMISRPEQVDGVIGVNLKGVGMLIAGLEPLEVLGLPEPVTSANVIKILQEAWNPPENIDRSSEDWFAWYFSRKQSIKSIMQAAMDKLLAGKANWRQLGLGMIGALNQRQLMMYTIPEAINLKELLWDGSLRSNSGDFLMVVDANVGFNKVNSLIKESINYQITLLPNGTGHALVGLNYVNQNTEINIPCSQIIAYDKNVTYERMMQACYYDYLRLIVPRGSQLQYSTPLPTPGNYLISGKAADGKAETLKEGLDDWTIFGQFFVVEYGEKLQTRLEYNLPLVVTDVARQKRYSLLLQKQPGTDAMQVTVKLTLPNQARLVSTNMKPIAQDGETIEFDIHLDVDQQLEIVYALAR